MIKEYQKTNVIKAEKLTKENIWDLKDKYGLENRYDVNPNSSAPVFLWETDRYNPVYFGDWIATGTDGKHWLIKADDFKEYYKEVMAKSTTDFDKLLYELQYKCREISPNLIVEWNYIHEDKIHTSVMISLETDNEPRLLAHCLVDKNISNQPQIRVMYREYGDSAIARYIVCSLNALASFADEWQKLEERYNH
ncbi:hypothetical protein [Limosilactobacillus ingluviei]|uniref:DUF1642 domain-containing protein n=1 Tax=Limosilactobacillus ingluviei DSM 15946 TaxID=1423760 RepID=A0A0R1UDW0_9LACO|nr:hypothetical protein [Limosilactobacillus ingluviei]KRL91617.1 hypothetical protein FC43_GL001034 [Limosilactobacillus ingluviei DSM 15946]